MTICVSMQVPFGMNGSYKEFIMSDYTLLVMRIVKVRKVTYNCLKYIPKILESDLNFILRPI